MTQHRFRLSSLAAVAALVLCAPAQAADPPIQPWPGSQSVTLVDQAGELTDDVSGLEYEATGTRSPGVLWSVDNGNNLMLRLVWDGAKWTRDTANGWSAGKALLYPGGVGAPDAEGVTLTDAGSAGGVFIASERSMAAPGTSRPGVLRYDVSGDGTTLTATHEWNLKDDLPAVGFNAGAESVEWVPDSYLVASGFIDESTGELYDPATHPNHGTGIFFVGLEGNGSVYAYALNQTSSAYTRVATFASGFTTFAALNFDRGQDQLWVVCDDNCDGRSRLFEVDRQPGATRGRFVAVADYARPTGMPNVNNEGFAIVPDRECSLGSRAVFWTDDDNTGERVLRTGTVPCSPPPLARAGWSPPAGVKGDFNGDGFGDLAVGVSEDGRGAVHVLRGSAIGVVTTGSQFWSQDSSGIADTSEDGDDFGRSLAVGDFNADNFADLAIGAPGENAGAGAVHVLYGSASGLTATGSQLWTQASAGVPDNPEAGDHFGATLAAGELDGSTFGSELAIGAPDEDGASTADFGIVEVLRGTGEGLTGTGAQSWSQSSAGVADTAERGDRFGSALAIGDLGGSISADLAIGVPEEDGTSVADHGAVHVLLGSDTGVTATGSTLWTQNSAGIADGAEEGDAFGGSLATGDLDGGGLNDLVVGAPGEDVGDAENAGIVQTVEGGLGGPTGSGSQTFGQATAGIAGTPGTGDELGFSVAVGDFGGDDAVDLAVGAPGEGTAATPEHGIVHVFPGAIGTGLTAVGSQVWSQNSAGIADASEAGDRFGASLAAADYGRTADADLAVGAPSESSPGLPATGLVQILSGSNAFLTASSSKTFGQATTGVADTAEAFDFFGLALGR